MNRYRATATVKHGDAEPTVFETDIEAASVKDVVEQLSDGDFVSDPPGAELLALSVEKVTD